MIWILLSVYMAGVLLVTYLAGRHADPNDAVLAGTFWPICGGLIVIWAFIAVPYLGLVRLANFARERTSNER